MNDVLHGTKASFFQPLQQHAPAVRYLLPMSWRRIDGIRPVFNDVSLNGSGLTWVTYADVPESYCLSLLYDELSASFIRKGSFCEAAARIRLNFFRHTGAA